MAESKYHFSAQVAGAVVNVDATQPVVLRGIIAINPSATLDGFLQFFTKPAASVTLGTTAPDFVIPFLKNSGVSHHFEGGLRLGGSALSVAATTTRTGSTGLILETFIHYGN